VVRPNFYPDSNPFQLAPPPIWWLKELRSFDPELVLLPSRKSFQYRLGRRCSTAPRLLSGDVQHPLLTLVPHPDTVMFAEYGLAPVAPLPGGTTFDRRIFTILRSRDIRHVGGGNKAADLLDARDAKQRADKSNWIHNELDARSGDYWASLHYRTGARTSMAYAERRSPRLKVLDRRRIKPLKQTTGSYPKGMMPSGGL